jgi:hypothetical protein
MYYFFYDFFKSFQFEVILIAFSVGIGERVKNPFEKAGLKDIAQLLRPLIKKGQPLTHIYAEHEKDLPVGLRTLYNYIDQGKLRGIANIDLRRKVGYKARRKKRGSIAHSTMYYRENRTYADLEKELETRWSEFQIVEMDTVRGVREKGKTSPY